ncbi:MAG: hypothetical protein JNM17_05570 [Archangium sp.]|nr:hypothetical protein [Archangium sp.]
MDIRIASPCTEDWASMSGDERVRHCAKCKLNVFNTREMSEDDVRAMLIAKSNGGRVCARVYRRRDGTILTKDCPTGVAAIRRKAVMAVATAASMLMAGTAYAMGRTPACPTPGAEQSWFDRTVTTRAVAARESMRESKTLGPLIEKLWPAPVMMEMGDIGP